MLTIAIRASPKFAALRDCGRFWLASSYLGQAVRSHAAFRCRLGARLMTSAQNDPGAAHTTAILPTLGLPGESIGHK